VARFLTRISANHTFLNSAPQVPIGGIPDGGCIVVKWRGKPVFIKKRTDEELADINKVPAKPEP